MSNPYPKMSTALTEQLNQHLQTQEVDPRNDDSSDVCTTIEGKSVNGEPFWIQFHVGLINFQHIDDSAKDETLGAILDSFEISGDPDLEVGTYMTFSISEMSTEEQDRLLNQLVNDYFEAASFPAPSISSAKL
jgi:hypothetical protein